MHKDKGIKSTVIFSQTGCLLPLFIILNLFFGWIFFKPIHWLLVEAILILLFVLNALVITKGIFSGSSKDNNVIDVEGKVVEDRKKLG